MKRKITKQTMSIFLIVVMVTLLMPVSLFSSQAAKSSSDWVHMNNEEAAFGTASYDVDDEVLSFRFDQTMSARMKYTGIEDAGGIDYTVTFDMKASGGAIGVYNYEETSETLYGLYLDVNQGILDSVVYNGTTYLDNFKYYEEQNGQTPNPVVSAENWTPDTDKAGARIKMEFYHSENTGGLNDGQVRVFKQDKNTDEWLSMGTVDISTDLTSDNADYKNVIGIQTWYGEAEISNIEVVDESENAKLSWGHMSDAEKATGNAVYDETTGKMTFKTTGGFDGRMNCTNRPLEAGKNYAIEFDMLVAGGAIGAYTYDMTGEVYGVYLDTGANLIDNVHFKNGAFAHNFWSQDGNTTVGSGIVYCSNWTGTTDLNVSQHMRVEYLCGDEGTLAGGRVSYYKLDKVTDKYLFLASMDTPANMDIGKNPQISSYFGLQIWLGAGTISNIQVSEMPWTYMSLAEQATASHAICNTAEGIDFYPTTDMDGRMNYTSLPVEVGKDYEVEFDMSSNGGWVGVYNYNDANNLWGNFLFTTAYGDTNNAPGALDGMQIKDGVFVETLWSQNGNGSTEDLVTCDNWNAGTDLAGARIRVELLRSKTTNTLAGGTVKYYKKGNDANWLLLGTASIPTDGVDTSKGNYLGLQVWGGATATLNNIKISEYKRPRLTIGGVGTMTKPTKLTVFDGDTLPVNAYVKSKYVLGWKVNGESVTTYDASIDADQYEAEYIDTEMLNVKYQEGTEKVVDTEMYQDIRFVASVNSLDYKKAGLIFSLENTTPELGGEKCVNRSTTTVYKALRANGELQPVTSVYPGGYSQYMFALEILNVPKSSAGSTIYARAYVEMEDGTIVYGNTRTVKISSNSIVSNGFELKLNAVAGQYNTQILNASGTVVSEQNAPVILRVDNGATGRELASVTQQMISGYYTDVNFVGGTMVATATVQSAAGSTFNVTDSYTANEDGGFVMKRDVDVAYAADSDGGFNSIVEYREQTPSTYTQYEYFMPSIITRDNTYLQNAESIGKDLSASWVLARDSQMGLPMVMLKNKTKDYAFSMGRIIDEENATTGVDESSNKWIVSDTLDYGSTGISNASGTTSAVLWYPGVGVNSTGVVERSHPVKVGVNHSFEVLLLPMEEDSFTDATVTSYKTQYEVNKAKGGVPDDDTANMNDVYNAVMSLVDAKTTSNNDSNNAYGIPFAMDLNGETRIDDGNLQTNYQIGFVGQQTSVGYQLIRSGLKNSNSAQLEKGTALIDFWATKNTCLNNNGFPNATYQTSSKKWSTEDTFLRSASDGMEGILDAYLLMKNVGTTKTAWLDACVKYADWLVNKQATDGSFPRSVKVATGNASDSGKHTTACNIRYLVRMYEATNTASYLSAAQKAGNYVYENQYQTSCYHGGCPDTKDALDRESAAMALYGFNSLYQVTQDAKYLEAAEHAAIVAASYVYTFDFTVTGSDSYNIYASKGTAGLSRISTLHWGADLFASYLSYEYFKLYVYTGDEFYYDFAELLQNTTKRYVNVNNSISVYGMNGITNEAVALANMWYEDDVKACMPWSCIAILDPINQMESALNVQTVEAAKEKSLTELKDAVAAYGAGGKFRR